MSLISDLPASCIRQHAGTWMGGDDQEVRAGARWKCLYADLPRALKVIGGLPQPSGWGMRMVPLQFPDTDEIPLYAFSVKADARAVDPATDMHKWAFLDVEFKTFKYSFDSEQAFITENANTAAEIITRPGSAYRFPSDNRRVNQEVGVLIPNQELSLTFHRLPSLNFDLYATLEGCVNSEVFVPNYYDWPVGCVQYLGSSQATTTTLGGSRSFEVTHKFRRRRIPINQIMRGDGTGFEAPVDDNGDPIYPTADLNLLFA